MRRWRRPMVWLAAAASIGALVAPAAGAATRTTTAPALAWTRFVQGDPEQGPTAGAMASDAAGNIYVGSHVGDFASAGDKRAAPDGSHVPGLDSWIAKLTPAGDVAWIQQVGGTGLDGLRDLEVLSDGRLAAAFSSESPDFPGLGPADHRPLPGYSDGIVTVLDPRTGAVLWSRSFGGPDDDVVQSIAAGPAGTIAVGGSVVPSESAVAPDLDDTRSTAAGSLPAVPFAAVVGGDGTLRWFRAVQPRRATPAGENSAVGVGVGVAPSGQVTLAGYTSNPELPTTAGTVQPRMIRESGHQGFVFSFGPGGRLSWGTYLGGRGQTIPQGVEVAPDGAVAVAGMTAAADFPRRRPLQARCAAQQTHDGFITWLSATGQLLRSTCWGGTGFDGANDMASRPDGALVITGDTTSGFPTRGSCKGSHASGNGAGDAFVLTIGRTGAVRQSLAFGGAGVDDSFALTVTSRGVAVSGYTTSNDFPGGRAGDPDAPVAADSRSVRYSIFVTMFTGL